METQFGFPFDSKNWTIVSSSHMSSTSIMPSRTTLEKNNNTGLKMQKKFKNNW